MSNSGTDVMEARRVLAAARADLDEAVGALPGGDEVMATPGLLALLSRALEAQTSLSECEGLLAAQPAR